MTLRMQFTLEEFVDRCGVEQELVQRFVLNAWISPVDAERTLFDEEDVARVRLICDLQQVMGINDEAVPVILHLIDQLNRLHVEIKRLS